MAKFKVTDIVKQKCGYWGGKGEEDGKTYIIKEVSDHGGYSIYALDGSTSSSWWREEYLEFISKGSMDMIKQAKKLSKEITKKYSDINWIKENWSEICTGGISNTSILTLFNAINFRSSFEMNGEYFALMSDWLNLKKIFKAIFNSNLESAIEGAREAFNKDYLDEYIGYITEFYYQINPKEKGFTNV